jgi:LmbE family N-acetylglucosaminyl deacetylase
MLIFGSIMSKDKTLVFFGAHPDDETFSLGATLALYVLRGVKVYCVCSTRGEAGTVDPELMKGYATIGDLRWNELKCAAQVLGLTDIIHLAFMSPPYDFLSYGDSKSNWPGQLRGQFSSGPYCNPAVNNL